MWAGADYDDLNGFVCRCVSVGTRKGYSITNCDPFGRVYTMSASVCGMFRSTKADWVALFHVASRLSVWLRWIRLCWGSVDDVDLDGLTCRRRSSRNSGDAVLHVAHRTRRSRGPTVFKPPETTDRKHQGMPSYVCIVRPQIPRHHLSSSGLPTWP